MLFKNPPWQLYGNPLIWRNYYAVQNYTLLEEVKFWQGDAENQRQAGKNVVRVAQPAAPSHFLQPPKWPAKLRGTCTPSKTQLIARPKTVFITGGVPRPSVRTILDASTLVSPQDPSEIGSVNTNNTSGVKWQKNLVDSISTNPATTSPILLD